MSITQENVETENGRVHDFGTTAAPVRDAVARQQQLALMRPTMIVGVGGSGQLILTFLKAMLESAFGDAWRERIRLLAIDTTEETSHVQGVNGVVTLEPNVEFFNIGNVPVGSIKRNIESQAAIKERLGSILTKLPAGVLRSGSKQLRPFGLMALLWNHPVVNRQLRQSLWQLAGRSQDGTAQTQQQGINVFICGSLVGGTGSGATLDLAYLIREAFTDLGTQAEFCHITGIGLLPQAFQGVRGPNMLPNTAAYLQELNHLMVKGAFRARYPDGRLIDSGETPFDIFYVVDGVDQRGRTWSDIYAVAAMAAHCIYLQMGTQLGQKGENAFDNLDDVLTGLTADGQRTFLGSFGKGDIFFDAPAVADICTQQFLAEYLQKIWLAPSDAEVVTQQEQLLSSGLTSEQLLIRLRHDPETGSEFHNDLSQPGWLRRKATSEIGTETTRYLAEYDQSRLVEAMLPQITRNGQSLISQTEQRWQVWLESLLFAPDSSVNTVLSTLEQRQLWFAAEMKKLQKTITEQERRLTRLEQARAQGETSVSKAAGSFPLGRNGRIREALSHVFRVARELVDARLAVHLMRTTQSMWHELQQWTEQQLDDVMALRERLIAISNQIESEMPQRLSQVSKGGVAAISLADTDYVASLYQQYKPSWADIQGKISEPLALCRMDIGKIGKVLLKTLHPYFSSIVGMTIEQVIEARSDEMSPQARRQQLFELATPSWNIDRARLPEGGANLVQLEVFGVPDATDSLFEGESMLVSTHDPYRLTASVVVAGAPPLALQQYDHYMQALEQARGKRPLYILPDFLTTDDQGRLYFALGSIFNLIYSQGTFFYYRPGDPLSNPIKLANGLSNSIESFCEQEEIVSEVSDRIERQIARLGLHDAIDTLTTYYTNVPNGNTLLDEHLRELKRLVRDYADSLRRIDAFRTGINHAVTTN